MLKGIYYALFESTDLQTFFEGLSIFLFLVIIGYRMYIFIKEYDTNEHVKYTIEEAKKRFREDNNIPDNHIQSDNTTDTPHAPADVE